KSLGQLRDLTLLSEPTAFVPDLVNMGRACGVAIVFVPTPRGCPASGAVRWLSAQKAVVQLSLRHKTNDHLWFTVFHEVGHLLLHGRHSLFLEGTEHNDDQVENEANQFAGETLISSRDAVRLPHLPKSAEAISRFASELRIAPGIVVGRMQRDGLLPWSHY